MRVAFIARYLQKVNQRKVEALAAQPELELWHVAPRRWRDNFRTYQQEIAEGCGYHLLIADAFPLRNDIHRFVYWPPTLFLNRIKPDIIHIEEEPDSLAALQAVIARRRWAPHAKLIIFTWQNILRIRRPLVERLARFVLRHADHVIAGNREAGEVLRQQGYAGPLSILPQLGVDTDAFRPLDAATLRARFRPGQYVVGYVGRFVPEKGLDILLRAVAPLAHVHVLLVGRGPQQNELEGLAQSLGLHDRLSIVSGVPHEDVALYLNAMDALVLPSLTTASWKEQFGHVLIEAMACGTPVVGSSSGAIPEVIGDAGLLFPEGDVATLMAHLLRLSTDPAEGQQWKERGQQRVADFYTHQGIAAQTLQIYQAVLHAPRR